MINIDAPANIAGLCADRNIRFAFTSTDLVFDGLHPPYTEKDPPCPVNLYGEQKVIAEEEVQKRYPISAVCRMPLMFGHPSPAHVTFFQQMLNAIRNRNELRLFVDEYRTPVSAETASKGLFLSLEKVQGPVHLGGRERISRYDLGLLLEEVVGSSRAKFTPCYQKDLQMASPRAPDVSLDSSKAFALGYNPFPLREEIRKVVRE